MIRKSRILFFLAALFFLVPITLALCGDGAIDLGEQCDGTNINGLSCEKLDKGYNNGALICNPDCTINILNCNTTDNNHNIPITNSNTSVQNAQTNKNNGSQANSVGGDNEQPYCGDGIIQGNEECDSNNFFGKTCESFGYLKGEISCTPQCIFDLSNCAGIIHPAAASSNDTVQKEAEERGGLINEEAFPVSNLFFAGSLSNTYIPEILGIVCGIWSIMMSFTALKLGKQRKEKEKNETLYNTGE